MLMKKKTALQKYRGLTAMATMIGRRSGVTVKFSEEYTTAFTDGRTIGLPIFPALGTEEDEIVTMALLDHELMHCRFTNFEDLKQLFEVREAEYPKSVLLIIKGFQNAIEDYWGELAQAKQLPGARINIVRGCHVLLKLGFYGYDGSSQCKPHTDLQNYLLHALCDKCYGLDELKEFHRKYKNKVRKVFGDDFQKSFAALIDESDNCASTKDACSLAERMWALIQEHSDDDETVNEASRSMAMGGEVDEAVIADAGERMVQALVQNVRKHPEDLSAINAVIASMEYGHSTASVQETPYFREDSYDEFYSKECPSGLNPLFFQAGKLVKEQTDEIASGIKGQIGKGIERLLMAKTEALPRFTQTGNRINGSRLTNVRVGRFDVFETPEDEDGLSTAVAFLLDASGSMFSTNGGASFNGIAYASCANALCKETGPVLSRYNIPFSIYRYGDDLMCTKQFSESWLKCKDRHLMEVMGGTMTGGSLEIVGHQLMSRPEKRKVLLLITDGRPDDASRTISQIVAMQRKGIEVAMLFLSANGAGEFAKMLDEKIGSPVTICTTKDKLSEAFVSALKNSFK